MGIWKTFTCSICGLAFCAHMAHEAHQNAGFIARPLATKPTLDTVVYRPLSHDHEPAAPSGPLQLHRTVAPSSSSVSSTVRLVGVSASGMAENLVWNPEKNNLAVTNPSSGSLVPLKSTSA